MKAPVPMRKRRRTAVIRRNERSRRMSRSHALRAIAGHERPSRGSPGGPSGTEPEGDDREDELEDPDREERRTPEAGRRPDGHDAEPEDDAGRAHDPDEAAGRPDLGLRHEVGDEALVGALGDVGAQLESDEERGVEQEQAARPER